MPRTSMEGRKTDLSFQTTEWSLNYAGFISLAFGGFILLGCVSAYIVAVARGNVDAFLPLISDAAGSPPQNGLFGTFICLGGMFGVAFMILRYMIVLEKNGEKSTLVTAINKLSLFVGIASMLGLTLVTGYPINFYRNRDVWLLDVGLPHIIGGVMLLALGLVYIALQCVLTLFLKTKNKLTLLVRLLLLFICSGSFVYHMTTVPDNFGGISHKYYTNSTEQREFNNTGLLPYPSTLGASLKLPIDTSGTYITSSITEWIFVISFCCFFFTFFQEAQQYSLHIVIETHSTKEPDVIIDRKAEIRRLSLAIEKTGQVSTNTAPEVRKYLRRDSTCQTVTDDVEAIRISSKDGVAVRPTKKTDGTLLSNAETDTKTDQMLYHQKDDATSKDSKIRTNCSQNGTNTSVSQTDLDVKAEKTEDSDIVNDNGATKNVN